MIKVMHVDTVFEVFILIFFILDIFFMHVGVPIWWWVIFSKPSNPWFRGKVVQKCPIWGHHTNTRSYGIKRWNTTRKKKKSATHLYHRDHDDRLILAIYVSCRLNEYLILRNIYFFAPKSLLVCIPTTTWYYYRYYYLFNNFRTCTTL